MQESQSMKDDGVNSSETGKTGTLVNYFLFINILKLFNQKHCIDLSDSAKEDAPKDPGCDAVVRMRC